MDRRLAIDIVIAFLIALILLFTFGILGTMVYLQNFRPNSTHSFQHSISAYVPLFIFGAATKHSLKHSNLVRQASVNRSAKKNGKISIFEGRGAVRNLAIFRILVVTGPLSMGDIQRRLNKINGMEVTYFASLNKRIHALVRGGYIGEVKPAADKAVGFKVCLYEVRTKFYLAYYLNGKSREEILSMLNEPNATVILSELISADSSEA